MIDQQTLNVWLDYDPGSGFFTWKHSPRASVRAGDIAGYFGEGERKTRVIRFDDRLYMASHLVFLWATGELPKSNQTIVFKDGDRDNLRLSNLELSDRVGIRLRTNRANKNNKTGYLGVTQAGARFCARFRNHHIGVFDSAEDAASAYRDFRLANGVPIGGVATGPTPKTTRADE